MNTPGGGWRDSRSEWSAIRSRRATLSVAVRLVFRLYPSPQLDRGASSCHGALPSMLGLSSIFCNNSSSDHGMLVVLSTFLPVHEYSPTKKAFPAAWQPSASLDSQVGVRNSS